MTLPHLVHTGREAIEKFGNFSHLNLKIQQLQQCCRAENLNFSSFCTVQLQFCTLRYYIMANENAAGTILFTRFIEVHDIIRVSFFWSKGNIVKISKFQNELMKSSFLPKYEQKIVRISALQYTGQKSWQFFVHILGEAMTSSTHSEIY